MGIYIPNIKKPTQCYDCRLISSDGLYCRVTHNNVDWSKVNSDCPLIEIDHTNTELLEFFNEFKKWKASKEVTKYINAIYGESNATQHTQSVESALNRESCNFAFHSICTYGDCNNCPYEAERRADEL